MTMQVLGLDIGGRRTSRRAHINGRPHALVPFALWKHPAALWQLELASLCGKATLPAHDRLAVTMTGELCDCFETRAAAWKRFWKCVATAAGNTPIDIWCRNNEVLLQVGMTLGTTRWVWRRPIGLHKAAFRGSAISGRKRASARHRIDDHRHRISRSRHARSARACGHGPDGVRRVGHLHGSSPHSDLARCLVIRGGGRVFCDDAGCVCFRRLAGGGSQRLRHRGWPTVRTRS